MFIKKLALIFTAIIVITCTVAAQDQPQDQNQKVIQHCHHSAHVARIGQGNVHDLLCRLPRNGRQRRRPCGHRAEGSSHRPYQL